MPHAEASRNLLPDADHHAELASSLLDRGELGFDPPGSSPTTVRGPVYPAWLAAGMTISRAMPWLALWSSLPGLFGAIAVVVLLMRTHGTTAAVWGGLIAALNPLAIFASARLLPDEFYGVLLVAGIALWAQAFRNERRWIAWTILSGLLLAGAALTRVTAIGAMAVLVAMTWGRERRCKDVCIVAMITAAIPLSLWAVRSSALAGAPTLVASLPGYNFWIGESAERSGFASSFAESRRRAHELMTAEAGTTETEPPRFWYATLDPRQTRAFDAKLVTAARELVVHHPVAYVVRFLKGLVWFWCRAETASRTAQYALVAFPILLVALFGLRTSWGDAQARALAWVIALHVIAYAAICPMARYSVQLAPMLGLLGGIGAAAMMRKRAPMTGGV